MSAVPDRHATLVAAAIMVCGMALIPVGDAFNKGAVEATSHAPITLAWYRFVIGAVLIAPVALWQARPLRWNGRFVRAQLLRGGLIAGGITCITMALRDVSLAHTFGAFFIGPFVALLLARLVLGEPVGRRDWIAVALGFVGVLLVVRPGPSMPPGILWAVAAGCFYGSYITATRATAALARPLSQLAGQLLVGAFVLLPGVLLDPAPLAPQAPWLMVGSGLASGLGNLLAIMALARGSTAVLAPLIYTQLLGAALLSTLVFRDPIGPFAALGLCLIAATGLWRAAGRR